MKRRSHPRSTPASADSPRVAAVGFERRPWLVGLALALAFFVRLVPWLDSDLWFDEVLTFDDYVLRPRLWGVFANYPAANNHVLFSALLWCWFRILDPWVSELLLRLPSALFACGAIVLIVVHWRRWLGGRAAIACGLTFAASLVFATFAYQLRGYSLSMLLGTMAVSGMMDLLDVATRRRGLLACIVAVALLPLVMPTNILLVAAGLLSMAWLRPPDVPWMRWLRAVVLPIAVAAGAGCSYYLAIWSQFSSVLRHAEGWASAWAVAGSLACALAAHLGILAVPFAWQHRQIIGLSADGSPARADLLISWKILAPALAITAAFLLGQRPAPFPRTFLVFLPAVTFAVALGGRSSRLFGLLRPLTLALIIAVHGIAWQLITDALTSDALSRGQRPQNLVMEYYRGRDDSWRLAGALGRTGQAGSMVMLVEFHDFSTTRYYWNIRRLPDPTQRIVTVGWKNPIAGWRQRFAPETRLAVQAGDEAAARALLQAAGEAPGRLQLIAQAGYLRIWLTDISAGGVAADTASGPDLSDMQPKE